MQDCIPPSAALGAVLVHARAILTRRHEVSEDAWSSELIESNRGEVRFRRADKGGDFERGGPSVQTQIKRTSPSGVDFEDVLL